MSVRGIKALWAMDCVLAIVSYVLYFQLTDPGNPEAHNQFERGVSAWKVSAALLPCALIVLRDLWGLTSRERGLGWLFYAVLPFCIGPALDFSCRLYVKYQAPGLYCPC